MEIWQLGADLTRLHDTMYEDQDCRGLALRSDGRLLAIGTDQGDIILYDLVKDTQVRVLQEHRGRITAIAFHPHSDVLLSGSLDYISLRDISNFQPNH